jgi:fatty acid desaturase
MPDPMPSNVDLRARRSDWISVPDVVLHLGFVFAPVFLAAYFGGWSILLGFLWFGLSQNSVANLMHETAHRLVFRSNNWSDVLGHRILAPSFLTSFELYRRRHWVHHSQTGNEHDTKTTYLIRREGIGSLILFAARCLIGLEALQRFLNTQKANEFVKPLSAQEGKDALLSLVAFQGLFALAVLGVAYVGAGGDWLRAFVHAALAYGLVYLYGMMSLTIFLSTLRAIAEHQIVDDDVPTEGNASIRNMRPTLGTRILFGSHGFCEHGTHHAYPVIPHYNLPEATRQFADSRPNMAYGKSYWGVLSRALKVPDHPSAADIADLTSPLLTKKMDS